MDAHDKAHYGIAGALVAAVSCLYAIMPSAQPAYPALSPAVAEQVVQAISAISPTHEIDIYSADAAGLKEAHVLMKTAKAVGVKAHYEPLLSGATNIAVGAPTQAEADKIKTAVETASGGLLKVGAVVAPQTGYYVSFGHIVPDED